MHLFATKKDTYAHKSNSTATRTASQASEASLTGSPLQEENYLPGIWKVTGVANLLLRSHLLTPTHVAMSCAVFTVP